jgi:hypothetical protein
MVCPFAAMTVLTNWVGHAAAEIRKGRGLGGYAERQAPFFG